MKKLLGVYLVTTFLLGFSVRSLAGMFSENPYYLSDPKLKSRKLARLYLPEGFQIGVSEPTPSLPLVVLIHGLSGNGHSVERIVPIRKFNYQLPYALLIPEGTINRKGQQFWNATEACCDEDHSNVDDVGYFINLLASIREQFPEVNTQKIYLIGHSNGGFMANRLACEELGLVSGLASVAGGSFRSDSECRVPSKADFLQIHAENDQYVKFDDKGSGAYSGGVASFGQWTRRNNCQNVSTGLPWRDFVHSIPNLDTSLRVGQLCDENKQTQFWVIKSYWNWNYEPHTPNFTPEALQSMLDFLLKKPL